jgi:hypothetical protein
VLAIVALREKSVGAVAVLRRFTAALAAIVGRAKSAFNRACGLFVASLGGRDGAVRAWTVRHGSSFCLPGNRL